MTLFVYKLVRQGKLFGIYCNNEVVGIKNRFLLLFSGCINRSQHLPSPFWKGKNIQDVGYKSKASRLLSKLLIFLAILKLRTLTIRLLIKKICIR